MLTELRTLGAKLWRDETGAVISAEAALVATLGVAGATVGMDAVSQSVNDELKDVAFAIRSLDQSYSLKARQSPGVTLAGSKFEQASVEESRAALKKQIADSEARQRKSSRKSKDGDE